MEITWEKYGFDSLSYMSTTSFYNYGLCSWCFECQFEWRK